MAYTKTTWATGDSITATKLNNIETGIGNAALATDVAHVTDYNNSGARNSIFRGKSLGSSFTSTQAAYISAGTFTDMYIGDYWTINNIVYRIAAFDYYYNSGDTNCTTHHVVLVPDSSLYTRAMNSSNTTEGGYTGSEMYTEGLEDAKTTIEAAFGDYLLTKRIYLTTAITDGRPSAGAWCDSEVELMNEIMVYGCPIRQQMAYGGTATLTATVEKSQLPLFALDPRRINIRTTYWLRDIVAATYFASVGNNGAANSGGASLSYGVRPAFCVS